MTAPTAPTETTATRPLPFATLRRLRRRRGRRPAPPTPAPAAAALAALPLPAGVRVARAVVLDVAADGRPRVRLLDRTARVATVEWALPYRYAAEPGDHLWVIARGAAGYALGVARGRGRAELWFPAGAEVAAGGVLRLGADRAVRIAGEVVALRARALEVTAGVLHEKATDATRLVRGLARLVAGRVHRVTSGQETVVARDVSVLAQESVKYDATDVVAVG